jgi:toxin ParE1/3/4
MGYRLSRRAQTDVEEIVRYIGGESPAAAERLIARFMERFALLETQPLSGAHREEVGAGLRRIVVGSYLVFYRIDERGIEILRILHSRRNITPGIFPGRG